MTVSALALMLAGQADAHCYSIWNYPTPQRCAHSGPTAAKTPLPPLPYVRTAEVSPDPVPAPATDLPLPNLENIDWGKIGDDRLRGLGLLRATQP